MLLSAAEAQLRSGQRAAALRTVISHRPPAWMHPAAGRWYMFVSGLPSEVTEAEYVAQVSRCYMAAMDIYCLEGEDGDCLPSTSHLVVDDIAPDDGYTGYAGPSMAYSPSDLNFSTEDLLLFASNERMRRELAGDDNADNNTYTFADAHLVDGICGSDGVEAYIEDMQAAEPSADAPPPDLIAPTTGPDDDDFRIDDPMFVDSFCESGRQPAYDGHFTRGGQCEGEVGCHPGVEMEIPEGSNLQFEDLMLADLSCDTGWQHAHNGHFVTGPHEANAIDTSLLESMADVYGNHASADACGMCDEGELPVLDADLNTTLPAEVLASLPTFESNDELAAGGVLV